jgi:hypothetical protein
MLLKSKWALLEYKKYTKINRLSSRSEDPIKQKKSRILENQYESCAYNWLAPEILANGD